jgi:hypothetical protein
LSDNFNTKGAIMTTETLNPPISSRPGRSIAAVALAVLAVVVLSLVTDQILHVLNVYPAWGEPMHDHGLNALALSYRIVYGVMGGYIAARLAPRNPMRHAMIVGAIGFLLSTVGAVTAIPMNLGPAWYPITLALTALPCSWIGGILAERQINRSDPR